MNVFIVKDINVGIEFVERVLHDISSYFLGMVLTLGA